MSYYNLLDLPTLLLEDQRGNIKRLLGFPKELADKFHEAYGKHSFALAKVYKEVLVGQMGKKDFKLGAEAWGNANAGKISFDRNPVVYALRDSFRRLYTIVDDNAILSVLNANPKMEKTLQKSTFKDFDALSGWFSDATVESLKHRAVIKFSDGYYWVKLDSEKECELEGSLMQHCGRTKGDMYSLRDKKNRPHVTMTVSKISRNSLVEIKGKQNTEPARKYWDYIKKFVEDQKITKVSDDKGTEEFLYYILPGRDAYLKSGNMSWVRRMPEYVDDIADLDDLDDPNDFEVIKYELHKSSTFPKKSNKSLVVVRKLREGKILIVPKLDSASYVPHIKKLAKYVGISSISSPDKKTFLMFNDDEQ